MHRNKYRLKRLWARPAGRAILVAALATAVPLFALPAQAQELVINGGFETGNLTGFTKSGNGNALLVNSSRPYSGTYAASFQSTSGLDTLTQTINTTPGLLYTFSFYLRNESLGDDFFSASFNDTALLSLTNTTTEFDYTQYSYNVLATSNTSTIAFTGRDGPARFRVDDITVTRAIEASAPEPGSLALLLPVLGVAGMGMRRRRQ